MTATSTMENRSDGIVLAAAYLERVRGTAFSALVGSKYAAVINGRPEVS